MEIINEFALLFAISLGSQVFFAFFAVLLKTDKVTDLSYALGFIVTSGLLLATGGHIRPGALIGFGLIVIWGIRLGSYLFIRIMKIKKDRRFDSIRGNVLKFSMFWLIQSLTIALVLFSFTSALKWSPTFSEIHNEGLFKPVTLLLLSLPGLALFSAGLMIEAVADIQKYRFKNKAENRNKWIENGLWKRNRHPNFLGESLLWFGIYLTLLPWLLSGSRLNESMLPPLIALISPITITLMVRFGSGVPLLEKRAEKRYGKEPEYQNYKSNSGVFFFRLRQRKD